MFVFVCVCRSDSPSCRVPRQRQSARAAIVVLSSGRTRPPSSSSVRTERTGSPPSVPPGSVQALSPDPGSPVSAIPADTSTPAEQIEGEQNVFCGQPKLLLPFHQIGSGSAAGHFIRHWTAKEPKEMILALLAMIRANSLAHHDDFTLA